MIIRDIYVDGFGSLTGVSIPGLKPGINIILGNNEAGKSTLQKFISYTFFEYPRRNEERMPPLQGGAHGGRITAVHSSGIEVMFERFSGSKGGELNLTYNDQPSKDRAKWFELLGNATSDLYRNIYAFSLDELVRLDSLEASGVQDKIFSVGLGLGTTSIGTIESAIQDNINKIYTARGNIQYIPKLLASIQQKKTEIQEIQAGLPKYHLLIQDISQLREDLTKIESELNDARAEHITLTNYLKCYNNFIQVKRVDEELQTLPEKRNYPTNGLEEFNKLIESELSLQNKLEELTKGTAEEQSMPEIEEKIQSILFNPGYFQEETNILYLGTNLERYKQVLADKTENDIKCKKQSLLIATEINKIDANWTVTNVTNFGSGILHKDKLAEFKKKRDSLSEKRKTLEAEEKALASTQSKFNSRAVAITLSLVLIVTALALLFYYLYIPSIALFVIAIVLYLRKHLHTSKVNPLFTTRDQLTEIINIQEPAWKLAYENYLSALNLDKTLSLEAVNEILNNIEILKTNITELDELKLKQDERNSIIQSFEAKVNSLKKLIQISEQYLSIESTAQRLKENFDKTREKFIEKEMLVGQLQSKKKIHEKTNGQILEIQKQIEQLIQTIEALDRSDFLSKYEDNIKINELLINRNDATQTIEAITGIGKSPEVLTFLSGNEKQKIEEKVIELGAKIHNDEQQKDEKNTNLGANLIQQQRIEGESELTNKLTELESLREQMTDGYKNWLANKIAVKLLTVVKNKYEKEKQPEVIKNSSKYFNSITNQKYKRISVSLDDSDVSIYDAMEASKKIHQLSRGTKEQLLISLRLGFIEEYEKRAEPLPLIVDEIFVNFDPERLKQTANLLHEFAQNRQILIFTCHPSTEEYFKNLTYNLIKF